MYPISTRGILLILIVSCTSPLFAQNKTPQGVLVFEKKWIASEAFESATVLDVNNDGELDIFSGSFWYKGPDFVQRAPTGPIKRFNEYYDDFSAILIDVNRDGRMDVVTGGWFDGKLTWRENPAKEGLWPEHIVARCGNVESSRAWDIDGDGIPEIVPNTPGKPLAIYRLKKDVTAGSVAFDSIRILDQHGHGLGYGDINGDGRGDLIIDKGWLEGPVNPFKDKWILHPEFSFVQASVPMLVTDVNGDGLADLIVGQGHDYGLNWYEQVINAKKIRSWVKHSIDPNNSQFHTMEWVDLDNDGKPELVTGKRFRAHDDNDPGAHDPVGIYYYSWTGESFAKQIVSYGAPGIGKGTGIYFVVTDLNHDNWKDIVVAGKDGLCVFFNRGFAK